MNHLHAAEMATNAGEPAGLFRYVCSGRSGTYALGYCANDPTNNNEHCKGHGTPDEAREHMRQYGLDNMRIREDNLNAHTQHKCEAPGCLTYTSGSVHIGGYTHFSLCSEHRTRDCVDGLYNVHESWES